MENIEMLYENLKGKDDNYAKKIIKDIELIDNTITQEKNFEYKKEVYKKLEEKYKGELEQLMYHKIKDIVSEKTEKYIESNLKTINTKLGNLKNMLIRCAGIKMYNNSYIDILKEKIYKENNPNEIYELYLELDKLLAKYIK